MASAVLWCVKTLPKEASMGRTQSVLDHGSLPASRLQHHERNIVSPDDVLPASQRPEKHHEVSRRHLWVLGARCDVGDRLDIADGVCLRLRVVVRICCLYGPSAAGSSHKRMEGYFIYYIYIYIFGFFFGPGSLAFGFWLFLSVAFAGIFGMSNFHTFQYTSLMRL